MIDVFIVAVAGIVFWGCGFICGSLWQSVKDTEMSMKANLLLLSSQRLIEACVSLREENERLKKLRPHVEIVK